MRINVTKAFLPPREEFDSYLNTIWENHWLTNNGPLVRELEKKLSSYLGIKHLLFVNNGTVALQIAIKGLDLKGEIITTPYSYCATTTSILWENAKPVFVDIQTSDFNINPDKIEAAITENTSAILATHVYGNPCHLEKIEEVAKKHGLKVIYDAAHAFGVKVNNRSLLSYGDISTCSFHATKLFHTIEGGLITCGSEELYKKLSLYRSFGHINDDYFSIGINGKNSEFHAAMGLCNLKYVPKLIAERKKLSDLYSKSLFGLNILRPQSLRADLEYNYAYYAIILPNEKSNLTVIEALQAQNIFPRRYFYPSLNTVPYTQGSNSCMVSEDIATRALALPFYAGLEEKIVLQVCQIIRSCLEE